MSLNNWSKKWLTAVTVCLLLIIGCSISLLLYTRASEGTSDPKYVINQVRLTVNPIVLYLEQNSENLNNEAVRETLISMSESSKADMIYAKLDGTVAFRSAGSPPIQEINPHTDLHYDLHYARQEGDLFKIAFPVINDTTGTQTGNVIFLIPEDKVTIQRNHNILFYMFLVTILSSLILFILFISIRLKIKNRLISPIHRLKQHAESILKGNYDVPVQYAKTNEIGELSAMFDLMRTEIRHLNFQRIKQEQAQKELITNISHELRTPIATVKAYIDAILEGVCPDTETMMEYVEVMRSNTDKTARLVEDLLIHALRDLGQISVEPREQYSQEALRNILKPIGHYIRANDLIYIEPRDIPNVLIRIDRLRIEQVISNLVTNALKHTEPGDTIRIDAELEPGQLKMTIADSGRGIRPQDTPFIFERYFKGQADTAKRDYIQEGTGLGLSICKTIIEAHEGHISFTSKEGQGTTFHFTLPIC